MNSRIIQIRKSLNLNQKYFADEIGMKQSSLSDIERGINSVTERTILIICSKFNVNENWLRNGVGEMFIEIDKKFNEFFDIFDKLSPPLQDFLIRVAKDLLDHQLEF